MIKARQPDGRLRGARRPPRLYRVLGGNLQAAMRVLPGVLAAVAPNVSSQEVAVTYDPAG